MSQLRRVYRVDGRYQEISMISERSKLAKEIDTSNDCAYTSGRGENDGASDGREEAESAETPDGAQ